MQRDPDAPAPARPFRSSAALALLASLGSCLTNEEELVVHPDGSVDVTVAAEGDPDDLADGYPVPLHGPWRPVDAGSRRWIALAAPDFAGGAADALRVRAQEPRAPVGWRSDRTRVATTARFARVADVPESYAPSGVPHRGSELQRRQELVVERRGGRTVYRFERTFVARRHPALGHFGALLDRVPEPLRDLEALDAAGLRAAVRPLVDGVGDYAEQFARDALAAPYLGTLDGPVDSPDEAAADLPLAVRRAALEAAVDAAGRVVSVPRLVDLFGRARAAQEAGGDAERVAAEGRALVEEWFAVLRSTLRASLEAGGAAAATVDAVVGRFDTARVAFDRTGDLGDESFRIRVRLPGTLVHGNYRRVEDGGAVWEFDGKDLRGRDVVLRAVSVVE